MNILKGRLSMKKVFVFWFVLCTCFAALPSFAAESLFDKGEQFWRKTTADEMEELIKYDANIYEKGPNEETTLMMAAKYDNLGLVNTLLKYGVDVRAQDKNGVTALMMAAANAKNAKIIETLIEHGAEITTQDKNGFTAIFYAAQKNPNTETMYMLILYGTDVEIKDHKGSTPLMIAAESNPNFGIVDMLIENGSYMCSADNEGKTAFVRALEKGSHLGEIDVIRCTWWFFVSKANKGKTALIITLIDNPKPKSMKDFISQVFENNAKNDDNLRVLDMALSINENPYIGLTM